MHKPIGWYRCLRSAVKAAPPSGLRLPVGQSVLFAGSPQRRTARSQVTYGAAPAEAEATGLRCLLVGATDMSNERPENRNAGLPAAPARRRPPPRPAAVIAGWFLRRTTEMGSYRPWPVRRRCRSAPIRSPRRRARRRRTTNHQTEVEPDTFANGSTIVAAYQVGRIYDGGACAIGFATSTNNGASWTSGLLPGHHQVGRRRHERPRHRRRRSPTTPGTTSG